MKKLLLIFFLAGNLTVQSQLNMPFADSTGAWVYVESYGDPWATITYNSGRYFVNGDTLINGKTYNKLFRGDYVLSDTASGALIGCYRNDSLKVYYRNFALLAEEWGFEDTSEVMLYDFGINIGDSVLNCQNSMMPTNYIVLESIDTVIMNSTPLKRWQFYSTEAWLPQGLQWVQGIGSDIGFFTFRSYFENGFNLCYFNSYGQDYGNDSIGYGCYNLGISENDLQNQPYIYPNPSTGIIHFTQTETITQVIIVNIFGETVVSQQMNGLSALDISSLERGVYLAKIVTAKRTGIQLISKL